LLAADNRSRALLAGDVEVSGDAFELLLGDQRADLGIGINAVADLEGLAEISDAADEFVIDLALDKEAGSGAADLTGIGEQRRWRWRGCSPSRLSPRRSSAPPSCTTSTTLSHP
jgi:hypothetical protein